MSPYRTYTDNVKTNWNNTHTQLLGFPQEKTKPTNGVGECMRCRSWHTALLCEGNITGG